MICCMSNVCKTCNGLINWDQKRRSELQIKGPLNPDMTAHRCYNNTTTQQSNITTTTSGSTNQPALYELQKRIEAIENWILGFKI